LEPAFGRIARMGENKAGFWPCFIGNFANLITVLL
jgi:hypothetical protein